MDSGISDNCNCTSFTLTLSTGASQECAPSVLPVNIWLYGKTLLKYYLQVCWWQPSYPHLHSRWNVLQGGGWKQNKGDNCGKHVAPIHISGVEVQNVKSSLVSTSLMISPGPSIQTRQVRAAQQCLYFLRKLKKVGVDSNISTNFFCCTIESIPTGCITTFHASCSALDRKALQRVVRTRTVAT